MKNEEIIQVLELHLDSLKTNRRKCVERKSYTELTEAVLTTLNHEIQACSEAVEIITRAPDDEPLTLDQLRNMVGCPVWIEEPKLGRALWAILHGAGDTGFFAATTEFQNKYLAYSLYGITWRAYAAVPAPVKGWISVRDQMPESGERVLFLSARARFAVSARDACPYVSGHFFFSPLTCARFALCVE